MLICEVNGFQFVKLSASQISQYLNYEIETLSCLGRQKRFLSCESVTKRSGIAVKVSKSSVSAPFEKLEFVLH